MKAATVTEIKRELKDKSPEELVALCLRLSKFKKENKELLTYLLYEASDRDAYITSVQDEIDGMYSAINTSSFYFIAKSLRKILRITKKFIRYTQDKQVEVELLLYYCRKMKSMSPSITRSTSLMNLYDRQIALMRKSMLALNEDLQYDYQMELDNL